MVNPGGKRKGFGKEGGGEVQVRESGGVGQLNTSPP
jgi:hypothetical protein